MPSTTTNCAKCLRAPPEKCGLHDPAQFAMSGVRDANVPGAGICRRRWAWRDWSDRHPAGKRKPVRQSLSVSILSRTAATLPSPWGRPLSGSDWHGMLVWKSKLTGKQGADVIIETAADALQSALRGLAYSGTISPWPLRNRSRKALTFWGAKRISIMRKIVFSRLQSKS